MSLRFLPICIAVALLGLGCSSDESASTPTQSDSAVESAPSPEPEPEPPTEPAPAAAEAPEGDGGSASGDDDSAAEEETGEEAVEAEASTSEVAIDTAVPTKGEESEALENKPGKVAPPTGATVPDGTPGVNPNAPPDPAKGGSVEPPRAAGDGVDGYGHPSGESILNKVAALMAGTRFRWIQGTKDVAFGFYGVPLLLNVWSCTDKDIDGSIAWFKGLETNYSDNMVSVLVPENVAERSLTGQDNICGRSIRLGRSHGVDVGKAVFEQLGTKSSPAVYVFNEMGEVVASHTGPITAGSAGAKKIEAAFKELMAPILEMRRAAP